MRRHQYPSREDVRKERRRPRHGEVYQVEGESFNADNMVVYCPRHHGGTTAPETHVHYSQVQPVDPASAKLVYLEAMQALLRDRLQSTWGRVQQKEEMEYEPIVELVTLLRRLPSRMTRVIGNVLEEFEGFVDKFEGDVAHATLKTQSGETFYGEYPAAELKAQGIRERRRFKCWTVEVGPGVEFVMEPIPDRELSEERERQIDEWLRESLGDDDAPQNDY
jgi:hypothetical protein